MFKRFISALALASVVLVSNVNVHARQFAGAVVSYNQGTGFATNFTDPTQALGAPLAKATPFSPASRTNQIVSIGAGGWIVLQFNTPIYNNPNNPFEQDFTIFGNSFFVITNGNFSGGGVTDGTVFTQSVPGSAIVSVSADGTNFYQLNPAAAPLLNNYFPSDGSGNPTLPVNPALGQADFAGANLAGIRALYNGSGGGASYDISMAQDTNGNSVFLSQISFVRVDVVADRLQIDALSGAAPQPAQNTVVFTENFTNNPAANGWLEFGNTNLFQLDTNNHLIDVTWDSRETNSYFYHPLGTVLTAEDDFTVSFNLYLTDFMVGIDPTESNTFQVAVGLFNYQDATNVNFIRGSVFTSPNLVEFDFFPNDFLGDETVGPVLIDRYYTNYDDICYNGETFPLTLISNAVYQIQMTYTASNQTVVTLMTQNGQPFGPIFNAVLGSNFFDFRVDHIGIMSYSDAGQSGDPTYFGSLLAHGQVGNIVVTTPPPPVTVAAGNLSNQTWQVQFGTRTNWLYSLQRTVDFSSWTTVDAAGTNTGTGVAMSLSDPAPPTGKAYYRVAVQPPQ